jgi:hypothetical protein
MGWFLCGWTAATDVDSFRIMIIVHQTPRVEAARRGMTGDGGRPERWELVLWAGEPFDYTTPFRRMLAEIAGALSTSGEAVLHLPDYEPYEDFIEGQIAWETTSVDVYYEHSLGYLSLSCPDKVVIDRLWDTVRSIVASDRPGGRFADSPGKRP